jgi:hypothetical protein
MGLDFIRQHAKTFKRGWDHHRVSLATPTLFTVNPECAPRTAVAKLSSPLEPGSSMLVRADQHGLTGYQRHTRVAVFVDPPADVVAAVLRSGGYAQGRVVTTAAGRVAEVALC